MAITPTWYVGIGSSILPRSTNYFQGNIMWIENCAADDMNKSFHHDAGPNSMLIQIMDPDAGWWL